MKNWHQFTLFQVPQNHVRSEGDNLDNLLHSWTHCRRHKMSVCLPVRPSAILCRCI